MLLFVNIVTAIYVCFHGKVSFCWPRLGEANVSLQNGRTVLKESSNVRHIYRNKCRVYTTYNDTAKKIIRYTGRKLSHFEVEFL